MAISRFDGGATAEAFSGLTLGVVGGIGFWGSGDQQFGRAIMFAPAVATVGDAFSRPVTGNPFDLVQRGLDGVTVVGVLLQTERARD